MVPHGPLGPLWFLSSSQQDASLGTLKGVTYSRAVCILMEFRALKWSYSSRLSQWTGKFWKRWEYQTTLPASREICTQVKKQQVEPDMKQQTGSRLGKEYDKAVYCHPAYLIYMQSTSCKMLGLMKHKLESRLPGEISITSDMQMTPSLWQKAKRN